MSKTDNVALVGTHKFEAAGLGRAPFRFEGTTEKVFVNGDGTTRAGGSCDYCGTSIRTEFWLKSSDGRNFKVGCDCIAKAGDTGVLRAYKSSPEYRRKMAEKRADKARSVTLQLQALMAEKANEWATQPHPAGFVDRQTGKPLTRLDYVRWMFDHCGAAGRASLLRGLRKTL